VYYRLFQSAGGNTGASRSHEPHSPAFFVPDNFATFVQATEKYTSTFAILDVFGPDENLDTSNPYSYRK